MRAFSIIALCLVSAVYAEEGKIPRFSTTLKCVKHELENRVDSIIERVNDHLDEVSEAGGDADAVSMAGDNFEDEADAYENAIKESFQKALDAYTECMAGARNSREQFDCRLLMLSLGDREIMPLVSEKTIHLIEEIYEIAGKFGHIHEDHARDLRSAVKDFGRQISEALKICILHH